MGAVRIGTALAIILDVRGPIREPGRRYNGKPMTESEWLTSAESSVMLAALRGTASDRKLRLFACACCRRFDQLIVRDAQRFLDLAEEYADGTASSEERKRREAAFRLPWVADPITRHRRGPAKACVCSALREMRTKPRCVHSTCRAISASSARKIGTKVHSTRMAGSVDWSAGKREQEINHARLLREVLGNPYRLPAVDSAWRSPHVIATR